MPSDGALPIGLDSLRSAELRPGFREIRVQVVCELCTPEYLFRIRTGPGRAPRGEAYLLQAHFTRRDGDTADARIDRDYDARAAQQRAGLRCRGPVRSKDNKTDACQIGLQLEWSSLLATMDRSGILRAVVDTGYDPGPPAGARCGGVGGETLIVEVLDGSRYGTAFFGCFDVRGPPGEEHDRAASARAALMASVKPRTGAKRRSN